MSAAVENEVGLMLSCKHPNVVAAFHYVTRKQDVFAAANDPRDASSSRVNIQLCPGSSTGTTPHGATGKTSFPGSNGASSCSNHSMDRPIPVLPGPKPARKPCPVCDAEVWPAAAGPFSPSSANGSSSSSPAQQPFSSSSSSSSTSPPAGSLPRGVAGEVLKCTCCSSSKEPPEVQSGLLNWQHEGGFWPAGLSALMEAQDDSLDLDDSGMVTTWLIQVRESVAAPALMGALLVRRLFARGVLVWGCTRMSVGAEPHARGLLAGVWGCLGCCCLACDHCVFLMLALRTLSPEPYTK
jgi:hypothetical protein